MMATNSWRGVWRTFSSVRHSRTRARVISDYAKQSGVTMMAKGFEEGGLEDMQFSEAFKNQG